LVRHDKDRENREEQDRQDDEIIAGSELDELMECLNVLDAEADTTTEDIEVKKELQECYTKVADFIYKNAKNERN